MPQKYTRNVNVTLAQATHIEVLPANADPFLAAVSPNAGASALVEFSLTDDFGAALSKQTVVVGDVTALGGGQFSADLSNGGLSPLTSSDFDGMAVAIETLTQGRVFVDINDITSGLWTFDEITAGEAFITEAGATISIFFPPSRDGKNETPAPGVKTNGLKAIWSPWTTGVSAIAANEELLGSPLAVRFTTSVAGDVDFELTGTSAQGM